MPSNDRRIDIRMKIHLGGLLVKAGLDTLDPETLYGALLALWTARVKAAAAEGGGVPAPALTRDGWSGPSRFFRFTTITVSMASPHDSRIDRRERFGRIPEATRKSPPKGSHILRLPVSVSLVVRCPQRPEHTDNLGLMHGSIISAVQAVRDPVSISKPFTVS